MWIGVVTLALVFHHVRGLMEVEDFSKNIVPICFENGLPVRTHTGLNMDKFIYLLEKYEKQEPERTFQDVILTFLREFSADGLTYPLDKMNGGFLVDRKGYATERLTLLKEFVEEEKIRPLRENIFTDEEKCNLFFSLSHTIYETDIDIEPTRKPDEIVPSSERPTETVQEASRNVFVETGVVSFGEDINHAISLGEVLYGILGQMMKERRTLRAILNKNVNLNEDEAKLELESSLTFSLSALVAENQLYISRPLSEEAAKWNSAECTRKYIQMEDRNMFTKANLLGALDGYAMGKKINEDINKFFKLSQLLRMYYSAKGFTSKFPSGIGKSFCTRFDILEEPEFKIDLREQVSTYILYSNKNRRKHQQNQHENIVNEAIAAFESFVPKSNTEGEKEMCESKEDICETPSNVVVVLDKRNHYDDQVTTVAKLINKLNIEPEKSNVMVLTNSEDRTAKTDIKKIIDTTDDKVAASCALVDSDKNDQSEMDDGSVLEAINQILRAIEQNSNSLPGISSKAVLYYNYGPYTSNVQLDKKIENARRELINKQKGAVLLAVGENTEHLKKFVNNPGLNIFDSKNPNLVKLLEDRICQIPAEFQYEECKKPSKLDTEFILHVNPNGVQYWQMQAKYFFKSFGYKLKFAPENGNIRVCFNRKPELDKSGEGCLQTDGTKREIEFSKRDPCKGYSSSSCNPFYFAIYGLDDTDLSECRSEDSACKTLNQIKVTFKHEGLACSNAIRQIGSFFQFVLAFFTAFYIVSRKS